MQLPHLAPDPGARTRFPLLHDSADALALATLLRNARPLLILTETAQDAEVLAGLGVDYGQGWHFGRPGPPEALAPVRPATMPAPRTATHDRSAAGATG